MKKLSILLAIVVIGAAIAIGILVSNNNKLKAERVEVDAALATATKQATDTQKLLDEANQKVTDTAAELETALVDLEAAKAAAEASSTDMGGQLEAAKAQYDAAMAEHETARAELEQAVAAAEAALKESRAKALGLQLLLENANKAKDAAASQGTELLGLVDTMTEEKGQLNLNLDAALAELDTVKAELTTAKANLETGAGELTALQAEFDTVKAELETAKANLETGAGELAALQAEFDTVKAELETRSGELAALQAEFDTAKAELETANTELVALREATEVPAAEEPVVEEPAAEEPVAEEPVAEEPVAEEPVAEEPVAEEPAEFALKHGLGMVTGIGSIADATAEKPGTAQVNTTVCAVTLDAEGRIVSVIWDVQQTKITFSLEGKPVDLPETLQTKLERGDGYGMRKASEIGKEWYEQIAAFGEYVIGKTLEEVKAMPVYEANPTHTQVPDVEELKASVTITVGDYLASLEKAVANAK